MLVVAVVVVVFYLCFISIAHINNFFPSLSCYTLVLRTLTNLHKEQEKHFLMLNTVKLTTQWQKDTCSGIGVL